MESLPWRPFLLPSFPSHLHHLFLSLYPYQQLFSFPLNAVSQCFKQQLDQLSPAKEAPPAATVGLSRRKGTLEEEAPRAMGDAG